MPILDARVFTETLKPGSRLLGLDISKNAIGTAIGDMRTGIATPGSVIRRGRLKDDALKIQKILQDYSVSDVVAGLPLNMDGSEGARCQSVRDTLIALSSFLPNVRFCLHDERQTTMAAGRLVDDFGDRRLEKKVTSLDSHAAMLILENFMDRE